MFAVEIRKIKNVKSKVRRGGNREDEEKIEEKVKKVPQCHL